MSAKTVDPEELQACIDHCLDCYQICAETVAYCLQKGGKHAEASHIRNLMDCAEICRTSAGFMIRGSSQHVVTCAACAEICRVCAQSCEKMTEDPQMKRCAELCRRCEDSCREMA